MEKVLVSGLSKIGSEKQTVPEENEFTYILRLGECRATDLFQALSEQKGLCSFVIKLSRFVSSGNL